MKNIAVFRSSLTCRAGTPRASTLAAFTLIELLVVVAVISILAGLIAGVVKHAREEGRKVICLNNERQLFVAMNTFASKTQNQLRFPQMAWTMEQGYWLEQSQGYFSQNWEITLCPSDGKPYPMSRAKFWPMKITTAAEPWYDPDVTYISSPEWEPVQLSYRGSCDGYRSGGYGPRLHDYVAPERSMLLNEAWDNVRYGSRQCSRGQDIWRGYPGAIDWSANWLGLTRHSGGSNFGFLDGSVEWIDVYSAPSRMAFHPNGTIPVSLNPYGP